MNIYLFLLPFEIILGLISIGKGSKGQRNYIIIVTLILALLIGCRSETKHFFVGSDVYNYYTMFQNTIDSSWEEIFQSMIIRFLTSDDVGFVIFMKIISLFTSSFYLYSFIASSFFLVPFGIFVYRYSSNIKQTVFAYVFFTAMFFIFFMSGGRQFFALGFDLIAFIFFLKKRYLPTIIFLLFASTIHFSSMIFCVPLLILMFITNSKVIKVFHLASLLFVPFVLLFGSKIIIFMGNFIDSDKYAGYGMHDSHGGGIAFILIIVFLSLFIFIAINKKQLDRSESLKKIYMMAPFFTFFAPLIYVDSSMIRIAAYFYLFVGFLYPTSIELFIKRENHNLAYVFFICFLSAWSIFGNTSTYYFFWQ